MLCAYDVQTRRARTTAYLSALLQDSAGVRHGAWPRIYVLGRRPALSDSHVWNAGEVLQDSAQMQ
jgi:hypothetical protein